MAMINQLEVIQSQLNQIQELTLLIDSRTYESTDSPDGPADLNSQEFMLPIWAEENSTLRGSNHEWAFGNGANTPADGGIRVYVPTGWSCELKAMSLQIGSGSAEVRIKKNGTDQSYTVTASGTGGGNTQEYTTPLEYVDNDLLNFRTVTASGSSGPNVVAAWLRYYK